MLGDSTSEDDGACGQLAFGQLEAQVGFGYQAIGPGGAPDVHTSAPRGALQACLGVATERAPVQGA
jgi:hypothetical protein